MILTAFFPIVRCVAIDLTQAIRKHTGLPCATGEKKLRAKFYLITDGSPEGFVPQGVQVCIESLRSLISTSSTQLTTGETASYS